MWCHIQPVLCCCSVSRNAPPPPPPRNKRQQRCVASLECGIFTGCPRGPSPPGYKGYNVLDVVVCLFVCLFFWGRLRFWKNQNSRETSYLSWDQTLNCKSMANIVSLPATSSFEKHCKYLLHRRRCQLWCLGEYGRVLQKPCLYAGTLLCRLQG